MNHPWKLFGRFCVVAISTAAVVRPSRETITAAALVLALLAIVHLVRHPKQALGLARKTGRLLVSAAALFAKLVAGLWAAARWAAVEARELIGRLRGAAREEVSLDQ